MKMNLVFAGLKISLAQLLDLECSTSQQGIHRPVSLALSLRLGPETGSLMKPFHKSDVSGA